MRKWLGAFVVAAMLVAPSAKAADYEVQNVFEDAVYGAGIGALVGLGIALIGNQTAKQTFNYMITGAGAGIIGGVIYGLYAGTRAVAEIEDGKLKLAAPTPRLSLDAQGHLVAEADLVHARF